MSLKEEYRQAVIDSGNRNNPDYKDVFASDEDPMNLDYLFEDFKKDIPNQVIDLKVKDYTEGPCFATILAWNKDSCLRHLDYAVALGDYSDKLADRLNVKFEQWRQECLPLVLQEYRKPVTKEMREQYRKEKKANRESIISRLVMWINKKFSEPYQTD